MNSSIQYRIIRSTNGFDDLEAQVSKLLNCGWKTVGGVSFNQGFCYQAMVGKVSRKTESQTHGSPSRESAGGNDLGANDAMKRIDDLT